MNTVKAEPRAHSTDRDVTTIYLIRHGETLFNTTDQIQGFSDSPLTNTGICQAKKVGQNLRQVRFDLAYTGDLGRQRNTLKLILAQNKQKRPKVRYHDGFKEWNFGGYEGKQNAEMWQPIFKVHGFNVDESWSDYEKLEQILGDEGMVQAISSNDSLRAAESYSEIVARGNAAMAQVIKEVNDKKAKNVLIVTSGGMIPTLLDLVLTERYQRKLIANCGVTIIKLKNNLFSLDVIGDTRYMQ